MNSSALRITLARKEVPELLGRLSLRVWHGPDHVPDWFRPGLEVARPCLGYGVIEPLELRLSSTEMTTVTAVTDEGVTLLEYPYRSSTPYSDSRACGLIQQLCLAVLRILEGQGSVHGGLAPFNIHKTDDNRLLLWSVPTARLELSEGSLDPEWELAYRSPQVRQRETPTVSADVYSLGKLLLRLLCSNHQQFEILEQDGLDALYAYSKTVRIVEQCLHPNRAMRYQSVKDLAADLDANSAAFPLDIAGAKEDKLQALRAFREERFEEALAHWQDALRKDWLDLTTLNNLAVTKCAMKRWKDALSDLEKAHNIHSFHPLVDSNIGYCYYKLGDLDAGDYWQKRARKLNPNFNQPSLRIAEMTLKWGTFESALKWAFESLRADPQCKATRLLVAKLLNGLGNTQEAQRHKTYADTLISAHPLCSSLITRDTPPPWGLVFESGQDSVLRRYKIGAIAPDGLNTSRHLLHKALDRATKFGQPEM